MLSIQLQEELKWEPDDGMKTGNDYRKLGGKMFARQYVYHEGPAVGPKICGGNINDNKVLVLGMPNKKMKP